MTFKMGDKITGVWFYNITYNRKNTELISGINTLKELRIKNVVPTVDKRRKKTEKYTNTREMVPKIL